MEELMSQTPTDEDLSIVNIQKTLDDFSTDGYAHKGFRDSAEVRHHQKQNAQKVL